VILTIKAPTIKVRGVYEVYIGPITLCRTSEKHGYRYANGAYCAHLIGDIPLHGDYRHDKVNLACPENHTPMNAPDKDGAPRHWVLEIHLLQNPKVGR